MTTVRIVKEAAQRMADSTVIVERMPRSTSFPKRQSSGSAYIGFYARITDREDDGPKCSWVKLEAQDDGTFEDNEDWGKGDHTEDTGWAVDINGCENVVKESIVWLEPAMGQDFYVFCYAPGVLVVQSIDPIDSDDEGAVTIDDDEINVHNPFGSSVPAQSGIVALVVGYEAHKGRWVIISEDCNA